MKCTNEEEISQKEKDNKKYKCKKCKCYLKVETREQYKTNYHTVNNMEVPYTVQSIDYKVFVCPKCGREYKE